MQIYDFISPRDAPNDAPMCFGGNLRAETLINAYKKGIFPWFMPGEPILWWSPNPRAVLFPKDIRVQKSVKSSLKRYEVYFDKDFKELINLCFQTRVLKGDTWLSKDIVNAYINLYNKNIAHCVSVYEKDELIGGLYGLIFGRVFCGESMISLKKDASKVALIYLCKTLIKFDFLIDCQVMNDHLKFLGAKEMDRDEFLDNLDRLSNLEEIDFKNLTPTYK